MVCLASGRSFCGRARVGVLELAEVEQRRAAQRQHEGVEVDRRQAGASPRRGVRRPGRRRRRGGCAGAGRRRPARATRRPAEAAPIRDREPALLLSSRPWREGYAPPRSGFNGPGESAMRPRRLGAASLGGGVGLVVLVVVRRRVFGAAVDALVGRRRPGP